MAENTSDHRYSFELEMLRQEGEIKRWLYESIKFRLADRTWYTPDFVVWMPDGRVRVVEVKGFLRDDAAVKYKVARETYPEFEWVMIRRVKSSWVEVNI